MSWTPEQWPFLSLESESGIQGRPSLAGVWAGFCPSLSPGFLIWIMGAVGMGMRLLGSCGKGFRSSPGIS